VPLLTGGTSYVGIVYDDQVAVPGQPHVQFNFLHASVLGDLETGCGVFGGFASGATVANNSGGEAHESSRGQQFRTQGTASPHSRLQLTPIISGAQYCFPESR